MEVAKLFEGALEFVNANFVLIGFIMAIVAYVKESGWLADQKLTLFGFALGVVFSVILQWVVLGSSTLGWASILVNGFAIGLAATGLYKTGKFVVGQGEVKGVPQVPNK